MRWLSKKTTGSVPRRAEFIRPLASYGVAGKTTFRPGMWAHMLVQSWLCWAPYLEPTETRSTTGIFSRPPDMDCHLASWLKISSPARPMKSQYINSTSGRPPSRA